MGVIAGCKVEGDWSYPVNGAMQYYSSPYVDIHITAASFFFVSPLHSQGL